MNKYYNVMTFMLGFPDLCWVQFGKTREGRRMGACISVGESPASPKWSLELEGKTIHLEFDPGRPDGLRLTGLLRNTGSKLILHRSYCDQVRNLCQYGIYYFPTVVYNHKGRIASNDYEIVVPWPLRDVANLQASDVMRNDDGTVRRVHGMVLDPEKITNDLVLFRVMGNEGEYFIRDDLMRLWKAVPMEDPLIFLNDVPMQASAKS